MDKSYIILKTWTCKFCIYVQIPAAPLRESTLLGDRSVYTLLSAAVPLPDLGTGCSQWRPSIREYRVQQLKQHAVALVQCCTYSDFVSLFFCHLVAVKLLLCYFFNQTFRKGQSFKYLKDQVKEVSDRTKPKKTRVKGLPTCAVVLLQG